MIPEHADEPFKAMLEEEALTPDSAIPSPSPSRHVLVEYDPSICVEAQADYQPGLKRFIPKVKVTLNAPFLDAADLAETMEAHLQATRRVVEMECGYLNGFLASATAAQAPAPTPAPQRPAAGTTAPRRAIASVDIPADDDLE